MLQKRDIEEWERNSQTSAGKAGRVPPKSVDSYMISNYPFQNLLLSTGSSEIGL